MAVDLHRFRFSGRHRFALMGLWAVSLILWGQIGPSHAQPTGNSAAQSKRNDAADKGSSTRGNVKTGNAQADDEKTGDAKKTGTGLPAGYNPPRDPPESMLEEKNLLTPEEQEQGKKELSKNYSQMIRKGDLRSPGAKEGIRNGIRYRLNELTLAKNRRELAKVRERLTIQDLRQAGSTGGLKPDALREFRRQLLEMVVEETEELFTNNYYVRLQAAIILGELNWMEEDAAKSTPREAFPGGSKLLSKVLLDPEQFEAVKIVSVLSLIRVLRQGNPNVEQKRDIATAVVSELKRTDTVWWYQSRLAEVLGLIDVPLDLNRVPFVFNALNSVLNDRDRDIRVRVEAAWSLGRHPLAPGVNIPQLITDVSEVGLDVAQGHAAKPGAAHWKRCATTLYLAFQPYNKDDLDATRQRPGGLLNNPVTAGTAKDAYTQLLPVFTSIINGNRVAPEQIQSIQKWLETRTPKPRGAEIGGGGNGPN